MSERGGTSRRRFLGNVLRGGALAALVGGTGFLAGRRRSSCDRQGLCRNCPQLDECPLPPAMSLRALPPNAGGR